MYNSTGNVTPTKHCSLQERLGLDLSNINDKSYDTLLKFPAQALHFSTQGIKDICDNKDLDLQVSSISMQLHTLILCLQCLFKALKFILTLVLIKYRRGLICRVFGPSMNILWPPQHHATSYVALASSVHIIIVISILSRH